MTRTYLVRTRGLVGDLLFILLVSLNLRALGGVNLLKHWRDVVTQRHGFNGLVNPRHHRPTDLGGGA